MLKGDQCQYSRKITCNNKGNPNDDGTCNCDARYAGDSCQYTDFEYCKIDGLANPTNNKYTQNKCNLTDNEEK